MVDAVLLSIRVSPEDIDSNPPAMPDAAESRLGSEGAVPPLPLLPVGLLPPW
jgi:hypothetical protein